MQESLRTEIRSTALGAKHRFRSLSLTPCETLHNSFHFSSFGFIFSVSRYKNTNFAGLWCGQMSVKAISTVGTMKGPQNGFLPFSPHPRTAFFNPFKLVIAVRSLRNEWKRG